MKYFALLIATTLTFGHSVHGQELTGSGLPKTASEFMLDALKASGNSSAKITSTTRTSAKQAQLMLRIIKRDGVKKAKVLYGDAGDDVIDTYSKYKKKNPNAKDSELELQMKKRLDFWVKKLGSNRTQLMHIEPTPNHTFDVAPSSLSNLKTLITYLKSHPDVARYIAPGGAEKALHVEIKKNIKTIAGNWKGKLTVDGIDVKIEFAIDRKNGIYAGVATIPGQNSFAIENLNIDRKTKQVSLVLTKVKYTGLINSDHTKISLKSTGGTSITGNLTK